MFPAHVSLVIMLSLLAVLSGVAKLRHDPKIVRIINEVVRVPMKWFPWLAACEFAGAAGLLIGLVWRPIGIGCGRSSHLLRGRGRCARARGRRQRDRDADSPLLLAAGCLVTGMLTVR